MSDIASSSSSSSTLLVHKSPTSIPDVPQMDLDNERDIAQSFAPELVGWIHAWLHGFIKESPWFRYQTRTNADIVAIGHAWWHRELRSQWEAYLHLGGLLPECLKQLDLLAPLSRNYMRSLARDYQGQEWNTVPLFTLMPQLAINTLDLVQSEHDANSDAIGWAALVQYSEPQQHKDARRSYRIGKLTRAPRTQKKQSAPPSPSDDPMSSFLLEITDDSGASVLDGAPLVVSGSSILFVRAYRRAIAADRTKAWEVVSAVRARSIAVDGGNQIPIAMKDTPYSTHTWNFNSRPAGCLEIWPILQALLNDGIGHVRPSSEWSGRIYREKSGGGRAPSFLPRESPYDPLVAVAKRPVKTWLPCTTHANVGPPANLPHLVSMVCGNVHHATDHAYRDHAWLLLHTLTAEPRRVIRVQKLVHGAIVSSDDVVFESHECTLAQTGADDSRRMLQRLTEASNAQWDIQSRIPLDALADVHEWADWLTVLRSKTQLLRSAVSWLTFAGLSNARVPQSSSSSPPSSSPMIPLWSSVGFYEFVRESAVGTKPYWIYRTGMVWKYQAGSGCVWIMRHDPDVVVARASAPPFPMARKRLQLILITQVVDVFTRYGTMRAATQAHDTYRTMQRLQRGGRGGGSGGSAGSDDDGAGNDRALLAALGGEDFVAQHMQQRTDGSKGMFSSARSAFSSVASSTSSSSSASTIGIIPYTMRDTIAAAGTQLAQWQIEAHTKFPTDGASRNWMIAFASFLW